MLNQNIIREKYRKRVVRERQDYISKVTGIPSPLLSCFKNGKKDLWEESLQKLNDYLDGKLEVAE